MIKDKRILLIVSGGIAAYKCLELIRLIRQGGGSVQVILTSSGAKFVTPLSLASLSGEKVIEDLFDLTDETEIGHIELSRSADIVVVAPASADIMAKMAAGLAPDLATTALLATDKPVLIAPAMNVRMWEHPATRRNLEVLINDGIKTVGPGKGDMACGEYGHGRMAEPQAILTAIEAILAGRGKKPLAGKRVLITAGPTHEPIDPVRYIANRSSGKQGYALAEAAVRLGAETILVSGPVNLDIPPGAGLVEVETGRQMLEACMAELPVDIAICAAAVADWHSANPASKKLKKKHDGAVPELELKQNPDILKTIATLKSERPGVVVGFAAETENVIENARAKLKAKSCDLIVANDVSPEGGVMGGDENTIHLVSSAGIESWPTMSKRDVADRLMEYLAKL